MAQKRIEEKLETFDQEISGIRVELYKLLEIEENLLSLAKSIKTGHPSRETTAVIKMHQRNSEGKIDNLWRKGRIIEQRTNI
ncbi:uncharacterized protein E6C27_scaffold43052G001700 [Cucumis melo var. makuwa]|uniref:Ty3-gypsy retrotransposon protein n=1 Tax=Cucumis melo var. makuwa TaxID=1194695 RepID=A0A5A7UL47_CUCMM|nr:uncharacterized protein E6C27_scaffold43052G001700 [Cucumis melo var. makuwa]